MHAGNTPLHQPVRSQMETVLTTLAALEATKDRIYIACENVSTSPRELEELTSKPGYYDLQGRFKNPDGGVESHLDQLVGASLTGHLRCVGIPQPSVSPFSTAEYMIELLEFGNSLRREPESLTVVSRAQVVEIHSAMWREFLQGGQDAAWSAFDRFKASL